MTTTSVLEPKLTGSLTLNQLTYHPDFYAFYVANQAAVDAIVAAQLMPVYWKYRHCVEQTMEEVRSDVLDLLQSRNVLSQYDPQRSALNTFITGRVNGYIRQIITKNIEHNRRWTRVLVKGLNAEMPDQELPEHEIGREYDPETLEDFVEEIEPHLDHSDQKILKLKVLEEMNNSQVARVLDKTATCISMKSKNIRDVARKVLSLPKEKSKTPPNKNNHPASRSRGLTRIEKTRIQQAFCENNGILPDDYWAKFPAARSLSIFQVTGFVTSLHVKVARGELKVADMQKYLALRKEKRALWSTYNSDRYRNLREKMHRKGML